MTFNYEIDAKIQVSKITLKFFKNDCYIETWSTEFYVDLQ